MIHFLNFKNNKLFCFILVLFSLAGIILLHYLGLVGLYSYLLGVGLASFIIYSTSIVLKIFVVKKIKTTSGIILTLLLFLSKLPMMLTISYFITTFMKSGLTCFLLGIGLVYCSVYFSALLNVRNV